MRARLKAMFQVCLALLCAVGAGFSGDLYAHHGSPTHHANRHGRGANPRGTRSTSRAGQNDQSTDIEVLYEAQDAVSAHQGRVLTALPAIVQAFSFLAPQFVQVDVAEPVGVHAVRTAHSLARFGRAPPAFA